MPNVQKNAEIFQAVKDYEGLYIVSNSGTVKSIRYLNRKKLHRNLVLKSNLNKYGYSVYGLRNVGISKTITEHRLVALAFIPNPENKPTVNHKNGIKTDNRVENHPGHKLTKENVVNIRFLYENGFSQKEIAKQYDVCHQNISWIVNNLTWQHI